MRHRDGQVGVWLFMAFLVLLIGVLMLVIFLNGRDPAPPVPNASMNMTYFNVSILMSNVSGSVPISYTLSNISWDVRGGFDGESCMNVTQYLSLGYVYNGSDSMGCSLVGKWIRGSVYVKGLFFPDKLEFYRGGVPENSTVLLEGYSDYYYFNSTICNISRELFPCRLSLNRKAVDYSLNLNATSLVINITGGILQHPIICVAYPYLISNMFLRNLTETDIPKNLHWQYDSCYVSKDISNITILDIDIHRNPFSEYYISMPISVLCRDWEVEGYEPVGDRIIYKNISFTNDTNYVVN